MNSGAASEDEFKIYIITGPLVYDDQTVSLRSSIERFVEQGGRWVVLDLERCDRIGSLTVGRLLKLAQMLRESEGDLILLSPSSFVRRVLDLTNLNSIISVVHTEDEARRRAGLPTTATPYHGH